MSKAIANTQNLPERIRRVLHRTSLLQMGALRVSVMLYVGTVVLPLVCGCSSYGVRGGEGSPYVEVGRVSNARLKPVAVSRTSTKLGAAKMVGGGVVAPVSSSRVVIDPARPIDNELQPTTEPVACTECDVGYDSGIAGHDRHCECDSCDGPCARGLLGFNPLASLAAKSRNSWEIFAAKMEWHKMQFTDSLHCKTAVVNEHWHQSKLAQWAAKKREEASAPPWPRFHPLPTRNVFYPEDPSGASEPTDQYGQFGTAK